MNRKVFGKVALAIVALTGIINAVAYPVDQVRAKLLAIGMPESEITDSLLNHYADFTNASLENELKFDNEILPKLKADNALRWEEAKQQEMAARQARQNAAATAEFERRWKQANTPENLAHPDFSGTAREMYNAYQALKQRYEGDPYSYASSILDENQRKKTLKEIAGVLSYMDSTLIEGFTCENLGVYIDTVNLQGMTNNAQYFLYMLSKDVKKKEIPAQIDSVTSALQLFYEGYGKLVEQKLQVKERGNEMMIHIPIEFWFGDHQKSVVIPVLFRDGKFVKSFNTDSVSFGNTNAPSGIAWWGSGMNSSGPAPWVGSYTWKLLNGKVAFMHREEGFIDFDWDSYVNQHIYESLLGKDWAHWFALVKGLSLESIKFDKDPYRNLKYVANGKTYSNLIWYRDPNPDKWMITGYTTKELLSAGEQADMESQRAWEEQTRQKKAAEMNKLIARCKACKYMGMSISDIEDLKDAGYLTDDENFGTWLKVTNKWGVTNYLRFRSNGVTAVVVNQD